MIAVIHKRPVGILCDLDPPGLPEGRGIIPAEIVQINVQDDARPGESVRIVETSVFNLTGQGPLSGIFSLRDQPGGAGVPVPILPSRIIDVTRDEGKYWLYLSQTYPQDPVPDDTVILRRIQRLFYYLRYTGIRPLAIDICRSVRSGYLPAQKAAYVQENFTRILEECFPLLYI